MLRQVFLRLRGGISLGDHDGSRMTATPVLRRQVWTGLIPSDRLISVGNTENLPLARLSPDGLRRCYFRRILAQYVMCTIMLFETFFTLTSTSQYALLIRVISNSSLPCFACAVCTNRIKMCILLNNPRQGCCWTVNIILS